MSISVVCFELYSSIMKTRSTFVRYLLYRVHRNSISTSECNSRFTGYSRWIGPRNKHFWWICNCLCCKNSFDSWPLYNDIKFSTQYLLGIFCLLHILKLTDLFSRCMEHAYTHVQIRIPCICLGPSTSKYMHSNIDDGYGFRGKEHM